MWDPCGRPGPGVTVSARLLGACCGPGPVLGAGDPATEEVGPDLTEPASRSGSPSKPWGEGGPGCVCVGAQGSAARGSGGEGGGPQEVALQGRCCVTGVLGGALREEHFRLTAS